jgi:hypothetical protein
MESITAPQGLVYLATPYTHPDPSVMESRFDAACRIAGRLMADGELVFSPIAHTHPIAVCCELPRHWEFWAKYDRAILATCARVVVAMLPGWDQSKGVAAEIAIAQELSVPVEYLAVESEGA